jgi:thiamine biosynthesis lipoprotein ApbE
VSRAALKASCESDKNTGRCGEQRRSKRAVAELTFYSASFEAIGVHNRVVTTDPDVLIQANAIAQREVALLDDACSRFRDDSELAVLNASAGRPMAVSELLFEAVGVALDIAAATEGLVDPTVGAAMRSLGYDRDFDIVISRGSTPTFSLVPASGWRSVRLDRKARTIRLPPGTELDLGATAKAFAADRIARKLREITHVPTLVSLGGDIAFSAVPAGGWPVRVADDARQDAGGQTIAVFGGALATSSTTVRRWRAGGVEQHHIVDPRSGAAADVYWRTVSVIAGSCVDANAAATAAIIRGRDAPAWLEELGLTCRLVTADGDVRTVGDWPPAAS